MIGELRLERPVLVVDDTNSTRYSTRRILEAAGARVVEAVDGAEALALAPGCGAVVLDVNLPDMDGFEVCRALRALPANAQLPIIHLSAQRLGDADKIKGLDAGGDAYLTHPVEPGVLVATLNALFRARAAEHSEMLARARFEAVFRTAPIGIALVAPDDRILESNASFQSILTGDGRTPPALPDAIRSALAAYRAGTGPDLWNAALESPRGRRHVDCRVASLDAGTTLLLASDNTKKHDLELERGQLLQRERQARAEAEAANRAKDTFLALLSHELRNPLAPISTAAQLLEARPGDEEHVRASSRIIARQVRHMKALVDDLMDVSRVSRGLVQLQVEPVDLAAVVSAAIEQTQQLVDARHHALVVAPLPAVLVSGDRTRLVQVFANLLNNAAKYTPPHGRIEVSARTRGGEVVVGVTDSGEGIAADLLPDVFELFTQGQRTPDRSQGGLGIGLALVKSVVLLHGGSVDVRSDGVGHGSTFEVTLPLYAGPARAAQAAPAPAPVQGRPLRVLVVDDNVDAASTLAQLIESLGHAAEVCNDPRVALDRIRHGGPYQVYVLDIGLPGITGHELAVEIRRTAATGDATLIALTGYGQQGDRLRSREAGFDHHLVKPVDHAQLEAILGAAGAAGPRDAPPRG